MAKRPYTRETVLLALALLKRIPRSRKVSARELHEQLPDDLSRDLRTVQRQLDMLADAFEIERDDRSKPYGYRWKERAAGLSLPSLREQESLLLSLAEEHLRHLLPASLMKSMSGFFTQARRRLDPHGVAKKEREWLGKVRVVRETQPLLPPRVDPSVFETVSNALYANRWLALDYRNAAGRGAAVDVMPLGLAQQGQRLYLVCRFEGFDNERSLALHRIAKAKMRAEFERPRGFDLKHYDDDGRFGFGDGRRIHLVFRIDKGTGQHPLETPLSADQRVRRARRVLRDLGNRRGVRTVEEMAEEFRGRADREGAQILIVVKVTRSLGQLDTDYSPAPLCRASGGSVCLPWHAICRMRHATPIVPSTLTLRPCSTLLK